MNILTDPSVRLLGGGRRDGVGGLACSADGRLAPIRVYLAGIDKSSSEPQGRHKSVNGGQILWSDGKNLTSSEE
jgi:hypothetical protein